MHNVTFNPPTGLKKCLQFPEDVTFIEMKKSYLYKKEIPFKYINDFILMYNGKKLDENEILKNFITEPSNNMLTINIIDSNNFKCGGLFHAEGKRIIANVYFNDSKNVRSYHIGTLNQIKELYKGLNNEFSGPKGKFIIYPGEIEVKENDERTFSEIGIRKEFDIILKKKNSTIY